MGQRFCVTAHLSVLWDGNHIHIHSSSEVPTRQPGDPHYRIDKLADNAERSRPATNTVPTRPTFPHSASSCSAHVQNSIRKTAQKNSRNLLKKLQRVWGVAWVQNDNGHHGRSAIIINSRCEIPGSSFPHLINLYPCDPPSPKCKSGYN